MSDRESLSPALARQLDALLEGFPKPHAVLVLRDADALSAHAGGPVDAVVWLAGLETLAREQWDDVLRKSLALARSGVLLVHTDVRPAVLEAEAGVRELYQRRFQRPHPELTTPAGLRLPRAELDAWLLAGEWNYESFDETPLDAWLSAQLGRDHLGESSESAEGDLPGYRRVVRLRTAEQDGEHRSDWHLPAADEQPAEDAAAAFARAAGSVLARLDAAREAEANRLRAVARESGQRLALRGAADAASALPKSQRRRFETDSLLPVQQIEADPETAGVWRLTGLEGTLAAALPALAGWTLVQLRLRRLDRSGGESLECRVEAETRSGDVVALQSVEWDDTLAEELYLQLPAGTVALRVRPMGLPGVVAVERFRLRRLGWASTTGSAIVRKLKMLRAYKCTGRVFLRGLRLLATGRFGDIRRKLYKGLSDSWVLRDAGHDTGAPKHVLARRKAGHLNRMGLVAELHALQSPEPIAVLMAVETIPEPALVAALESLLRQIYPHWVALMAVTPFTPPRLRHVVTCYAHRDPRIREVLGPAKGGIAAACNAALAQAGTTDVAVLNPGFELLESALLRLAQQRTANPAAVAVLNKLAADARGTVHDPVEAFLPGGAARQLNAVRVRDALAAGGFPEMDTHRCRPGVELARRVPAGATVGYVGEPLTVLAHGWSAIEPAEPRHPAMGDTPLLVQGDLVGISGYDYVVFEVLRGLQGVGVNLGIHAGSRVRHDLLGPTLAPLVRAPEAGDSHLLIAPPHLLKDHRPEPGGVILTMWESDTLNPGDVEWLNRARLVLVPSRWAVERFRASGVNVPVKRVPLGFDPLTFHPGSEWPAACTFGTAGALWGGGVRKNTARVVDAFLAAFPDETDVRLRVKVTPRCDVARWTDPRIEVVTDFLPPADMAEWYRSLTAYVNASAAEGFGLHLIEAMACGRPLVTPLYSAVADYADETTAYPVDYDLVPAEGEPYAGHWSRSDFDSLVAGMRAVYADDAEARRRGDAAAARARRFTWKRAGRALLAALCDTPRLTEAAR